MVVKICKSIELRIDYVQFVIFQFEKLQACWADSALTYCRNVYGTDEHYRSSLVNKSFFGHLVFGLKKFTIIAFLFFE